MLAPVPAPAREMWAVSVLFLTSFPLSTGVPVWHSPFSGVVSTQAGYCTTRMRLAKFAPNAPANAE